MAARRTTEVFWEISTLVWREASRFVKVRLVLALVLLVGVAVITALAPVALKLVVDAFTAKPDAAEPSILWLVFLYVLSQWAARGLSELRAYVDAQANRRMYRLLSDRLFAHVMDLPLRFHLERRTGALNETLTNGLYGYQMVLQQTVYTVLPVLIELAAVAAVLASLSQLTFMLAFFAALLAYGAAFAYGTARITAHARNASTSQIDERAIMTDAILNYETVKFFTAEQHVRQRLDGALSRTEADWMRFFRSRALNGLMISTIFAAFLAATTVYAARQVLRGSMTIGDFVLINSYMFQLVRPVEALGFAMQGLSQGMAFLEKVVDLFKEKRESRSHEQGAQVSAGGTLEFRHVSVSYRANQPVLRDVSFRLPKGSSLGIVGTSGAGKSTLVRLLVRLLDPDCGRILMDGVPISALPLDELRQAIAVVPQDTVLFNDTIRYNIAFGKPGSTQEQIEEAAKVARLHDFISSLPDGYDTNVGERGLKLSGGEKQRVSIARAALKQPHIYVFDEATSSLDSRTESDIMENLRELSRFNTTLIIAHRLSTVAHADQIVVIDTGAVVECGTHQALLEVSGKYAALWRAQQRGSSMQTIAGQATG
jgi:ABC-type transport system involved in Fe-S cluster assembly fused permease/ATPase subunit